MWFSVTYLVKFAICNKLIFFSLFTKLFRFIKPYQSIHIIYLNFAESFSTALNMCCLEIQISLTWNYRLVPLTWNGQLKNGKTLLVSKVTIRFVFPCQTSITGPFFCRNRERLLAVNYFYKNDASQMFDSLLNTPLRKTPLVIIIAGSAIPKLHFILLQFHRLQITSL